MSLRDNIHEMIHREPFQSFRLVTTTGRSYIVHDPDLLVLMRSEVFIAQPNSDKHAFVPLLHVSAVDTLDDARRRRTRRQKRK